jgi:ABC-type multidrug transport system fused ATPase/permease subunit
MSIIMQVPKIFNYTILDNIIYGNKTAKNSEIAEAVETANCKDFVTEGKVHKYDFSAESLLKTMKVNE